MAEGDTDLASVLPIDVFIPNNSHLVKTLPFCASEQSKTLRAALLERTKQRWAWFTDAEDQDRERGTHLGTLGYLPWEIRQEVFKDVYGRYFDVIPWINGPTVGHEPRITPIGIPDFLKCPGTCASWDIFPIVSASPSIRPEVQYAYITTANFVFDSPRALTYFLGDVPEYERSLFRSVTLLLGRGPEFKSQSEAIRDACMELPSGLTSITFRLEHCPWDTTNLRCHKVVEIFELLGKQIKRCWAPRAKISMEHYCWGHKPECPRPVVASAFNDLEPWSQGWLDWWESSQNHDQAEEQSSPPKDSTR